MTNLVALKELHTADGDKHRESLLAGITVAVFRRVVVLPFSVMLCALDVVTLRYRLPGRGLLPGSGYGEEPGAVVVPAGDGLVPPSPDGPVQREGEGGAGDQPGGVLPGETGEPDGLGDRQPDGGDAGRAALAAADRDGRVTEGNQQVSVADIAVVHGVVAGVVPGAGELDVAGERVADGGGPELGEGGQGGVQADAVPAPGLGLVPAEHVLARLNVSSAASGARRW